MRTIDQVEKRLAEMVKAKKQETIRRLNHA